MFKRISFLVFLSFITVYCVSTLLMGCSDDQITGRSPVISAQYAPDNPDDALVDLASDELIDFGLVRVGVRKAKAIKIINTGTAELFISKVEVVKNTVDTEFSISLLTCQGEQNQNWEGEPFNVEPSFRGENTYCEFLVNYTPTQIGEDRGENSGQIVIHSDSSGSTEFFINLGGEGAEPEIEVCLTGENEICINPDENFIVDFGNLPLEDSATKNFIIKNHGNFPLEVSSITNDISTTQEFSVTPSPFEDSITEGSSSTFSITYSPIDGGIDEGLVTIVNDDRDEPNVEIILNGNGLAPNIFFDPSHTLDFGMVNKGTELEKSITVSNVGALDLEITEMSIVETATSPEFSISVQPSLPMILAPNENYELVLKYKPEDFNIDEGKVKFISNDPVSEKFINLRGQGAEPCNIEINPQTVEFGRVAAGTSRIASFVITNGGDSNCVINSIEQPEPQGEFNLISIPPINMPLRPGEAKEIEVGYRPNDLSEDTATIRILSSDYDEPTAIVSLHAVGGEAPICKIAVEPSSSSLTNTYDGVVNFGSVKRGRSKTMAVRAFNVGTADCEVTGAGLVSTTHQDFSIASVPAPLPNSNYILSPNTVGIFEIKYAPTEYGRIDIDDILRPSKFYIDTTDTNHQLVGTFQQPPPGRFIHRLVGRSVESAIDVIPDEVDFGVITVGCSSPEVCVKVWNSGTAALVIEDIALDPSTDPSFQIQSAPMPPVTVNQGEFTQICLKYVPSTTGSVSGILIIKSDAYEEPEFTIPLSGEGTLSSHQIDVFTQLAEPKVDVLWVVDNSGSMGEEQDNLSNNFNQFMIEAQTMDVDYQIGVITTEIQEASDASDDSGHPGMRIEPGVLFGDPKIITNTPSAESQFSRNIKVGTCCSDEAEAGLKAAKMALSSPLVDDPSKNGGFLRDDAKLSIIFVSDEDDQSDGSVDLYADFFKNIKGFRNEALMFVSAIVGDSPNGCQSGQTGDAAAGERYIELTRLTGGYFRSICDSSWGQNLADLGVLTFGTQIQFFLSRLAISSTIQVRINGSSIIQDPNSGWAYDSQSNSITFGPAGVPPEGATIEVEYDVICL